MYNFIFCPRCGSSKTTVEEFSLLCQNCSLHIFKNSSTAVSAVIIHDNNLLTITRKHAPSIGMLDLPGGFVDPDESAETALKREINEELNLQIESMMYITSHPNNYEYGKIIVPCTELFFKADVSDFSPLKANDDAESITWIPFSKVNSSDFAFSSTRYFLDTFITSQKYTL